MWVLRHRFFESSMAVPVVHGPRGKGQDGPMHSYSNYTYRGTKYSRLTVVQHCYTHWSTVQFSVGPLTISHDLWLSVLCCHFITRIALGCRLESCQWLLILTSTSFLSTQIRNYTTPLPYHVYAQLPHNGKSAVIYDKTSIALWLYNWYYSMVPPDHGPVEKLEGGLVCIEEGAPLITVHLPQFFKLKSEPKCS